MGYYLAGFDVIGVDIDPQPSYPFPFIRRDGLSVLRDDRVLREVDIIHARPPCLPGSLVDLDGVLWVAETTEKILGSVVLCGTHFNLGTSGRVLRRHRRFAASFRLPDPGPCWCEEDRLSPASPQTLSQAVPPDYTRWIAEQVANRYFRRLLARDHLHDRYSPGRIERVAKL
jgi:hypothetical protein